MGGDNFPYLIRTERRRPIRMWLQSGKHDADIPNGNVALANQTMAAALEYAGYDHRFEFGEGGHSLAHGGAQFAESLKWIFRPGSFAGCDKEAKVAEIAKVVPKYKEFTQELIKSLANKYIPSVPVVEIQADHVEQSSMLNETGEGGGSGPSVCSFPGAEAVVERLKDPSPNSNPERPRSRRHRICTFILLRIDMHLINPVTRILMVVPDPTPN